MESDVLMEQLGGKWFAQVSENLQARSDERAQIESELKRFGELLIKALESGDPGWLKPLLIEWVQKRTLTTLEKKEDLPSILSTIVLEIRREAKENLPTEDALNLMDSLLPIFSYCYEEIAYNDVDGSGTLSIGDEYYFMFSEPMDMSLIVDGTTDANTRLVPD